jgi:hypothetical protein
MDGSCADPKEWRTLVRSIRMNLPTLALMSALGLLLTACSRSDAPRLVWASEFGGGGTDDCDDVAVDESQLLLLACHSESNDFASVKREGSQTNAGMDAYVVKLDLSAGRLVWAVRLGGSKYDGAFRIHLDAGGAWVTGYTESPDFPTTPDALQNHFGGGQGDGLLARINSDGHLAYSTYFGGAGSDQTTDVVSDPRTGMIHLIGMTSSPELPGACNSRGGKEDAFLASFYSQQRESLRTFYLGGSEDEKPTALALHPEGQLALTGYTYSRDFPIRGAFQSQLRGKNNAFLVRFNPGSGQILSSTFFGGSGEDSAWGLVLNQAGEIHLLGISNSPDFPTTPGALQSRLAGGFDTFLSRFDASAERLLYSSYFGGSGEDICGVDGKNLSVDRQGGMWFVGMTESRDLPLRHPHQPSYGGGDRDGFVAGVSATGSTLEYGSYHGGTGRDLLEGLFLADDVLYATGVSFNGGAPLRGSQLPNGAAPNAILVGLQINRTQK